MAYNEKDRFMKLYRNTKVSIIVDIRFKLDPILHSQDPKQFKPLVINKITTNPA
jgi:hypothetical protein